MQFQTIDKERYRQRYKTVSYLLAAALVLLGLGMSALFVALWGVANSGDNFWLNLSGVGTAAVLIATVLYFSKNHTYLVELRYVWELKQSLNQINRKRLKLQQAAQQGDATALLILQYYYTGCEQLWTLDDNTLIMPELRQWQAELEGYLQQFSISVDISEYQPGLLQSY